MHAYTLSHTCIHTYMNNNIHKIHTPCTTHRNPHILPTDTHSHTHTYKSLLNFIFVVYISHTCMTAMYHCESLFKGVAKIKMPGY